MREKREDKVRKQATIRGQCGCNEEKIVYTGSGPGRFVIT